MVGRTHGRSPRPSRQLVPRLAGARLHVYEPVQQTLRRLGIERVPSQYIDEGVELRAACGASAVLLNGVPVPAGQ
jgi:hypothetical protein